jgi:hypothetical protein
MYAIADMVMRGIVTFRKVILAVVFVTCWSSLSYAQLLNGDFSQGLTNWTVYYPPGNIFPPANGLTTIDIDGPGPLTNSTAYYANPGDDSLVDLQQTVTLTLGVTYHLSANLAMTTQGDNADGGTIVGVVGLTPIASYSFGAVTAGVNEYAVLSGDYLATSSGPQTFGIDFSRAYGAGGTPNDYITNIVFDAIPEPGSGALVICGFLSMVVRTARSRCRATIPLVCENGYTRRRSGEP